MKVILFVFGGIIFLMGCIKIVAYINKLKSYKHFSSVKGCVIGFFSPDKEKNYENDRFGFDVINYYDDDQPLLFKEGVNINAGIVEYLVDDKKYQLLDPVSDTNLMKIGNEVLVKYDPKKPHVAFIADGFDDNTLFIVGTFLIVVGILI